MKIGRFLKCLLRKMLFWLDAKHPLLATSLVMCICVISYCILVVWKFPESMLELYDFWVDERDSIREEFRQKAQG